MPNRGRQNRGRHPHRTAEEEAALAAVREVEEQKELAALQREVTREVMQELVNSWQMALSRLERFHDS